MFDVDAVAGWPRDPAFTAAVARMLTHPSAARLLAAGARVQDMCGEPGWSLIGDHEATPTDEAPSGTSSVPGPDELFAPWGASLEAGGLLLDMLRDEQRAIGAAEARRARWIVDFCRSRPSSNDRPDTEIGAAAAATRAARPPVLATVSEWAVDEVATALSVTSARAQAWMVQSLQLVDLLPATLDALAAGELTWEHATALCQVVAPLDDEHRAEAEARVLARLGHKTPTQLRTAAHRVVQRLDGQAIGRRVQTALRERGVQLHPTGDGLGTLCLTDLPLPVLRAVQDALRQYADAAQAPGDQRTRQQRMADCLVDLVLRPGAHGLAPVQAQLTIIATVRTLLGGDDPGEIAGEVVPAGTVRALARALGLLPAHAVDAVTAVDDPSGTARPADAERTGDPHDAQPTAEPTAEPTEAAHAARAVAAGLTGLLDARTLSGTALAHRPHIAVVDELTGQLLALTDAAGLRAGQALGLPSPTHRYAPTDALRRHVQLRDRRCRFPGCRRPGRGCDQHHLTRWPLGDTSAENLCCLCRHHHRLVHQAPGWQLHALADGALRFTTPTGQVLVTHPGGLADDDPMPGRSDGPPPRGGSPGRRPATVLMTARSADRLLLPRLDGDRQVVPLRRQRAGRELRVGAGQVGGPVEVQDHGAFGVRRVDLQRPVGRVGGDARGLVGEQHEQAARGRTVEGGQRQRLPVELELDPSRGVVHVLQPLDDRADGGRPRLVERQVAPGHRPARVRRVGRRPQVALQHRVVRVPRPDDVRAPAPRDLDHRLAGAHGHPAALRDDAEGVLTAHRRPVDDELLTVGEPDHRAAVAGPPLPRRVREPLGLPGQPVQPGDRQEPVRVGAHPLVLGVPPLPLLRERVGLDDGHGQATSLSRPVATSTTKPRTLSSFGMYGLPRMRLRADDASAVELHRHGGIRGVSTIAVVGNPKPRSRTRSAAELVVERLTGAPPDRVVDVIDLGAGLLGWGDPDVADAVTALREAEVAVVASPTYKATYTGLLKLFLDQVGTGDLAGVVAVPLMLGGGPGHALAPDLLLKPVLVELGATTPTKGLYLIDKAWDSPGPLDEWLRAAGPQVAAARTAGRPTLG